MTQQEREWFLKLAEDRKDSARVFMKASNIGVWKAIIDKYSDQAHFIYELLQNADDAGATKAEFVLDKHQLLFKHNGTRRFSVTSPETEGEDFKSGKVGDLNSITGAGGFSTKRTANEEGNAIGKFGVGFKAVFQYTTRPEIYDDGIAFRLENYIVPVIIDSDNPLRKKGETLFVFPLDKDEIKDPSAEIWKKLNTLVFPTLFLNKLQSIVFSNGAEKGEYKVNVTKSFKGEDFEARKIIARSQTASGDIVHRMWLFTRCDDLRNKYSVGYMVDGAGKLMPIDYKAFCYFPTKHETKLKFIIHAPFLLTDSRESIKDGVEHNVDMIEKLAQLATAGLKFLCEKQKEEKQRIVDDDVVKVIPIKCEDYGDGISFDQFRKEFKYLFATEEVVPTKEGCTNRSNAYWPESFALAKQFSDSQLDELLGEAHFNKDADGCLELMHWAFSSFPKERRSNNYLDAYIFDFIAGCVSDVITDKEMISAITESFIESQSREWLFDFYKWIAGNDSRMDAAEEVPIFLDQNGKACAALKDGRKNLFLPLEGETRYHFVNEELRNNPAVTKIIKYYELEQPNMADYIDLVIREKLEDATPGESDKYFKQIFEYYVKLPMADRCSLTKSLAGKICLRCVDSFRGEVDYVTSSGLVYFPADDIKTYFENYIFDCTHKTGVWLIDYGYYLAIVGAKYNDELTQFLEDVGVNDTPVVICEPSWYYRNALEKLKYSFSHCAESKKHLEKFLIRSLLGGNVLLDRIVAEKDFNKKKLLSILLWRMLCRCAVKYTYEECYSTVAGCECNFLSGTHEYEYFGRRSEAFDSPFLVRLRKVKWIIVNDFEASAPCNTAVSELPECYDNVEGRNELIAALKMQRYTENDLEHQKVLAAREALSEDDKKILAIGEAARKLNITVDEIFELAELKREKERRANLEKQRASDQIENTSNCDDGYDGSLESEAIAFDSGDENPNDSSHKRPSPGSVMSNIERSVEKLKENAKVQIPIVRAEDEEDGDETTPKTIDFEKRIKDRELKQANEIAALEKGDELQKAALQYSKYSLGWFKAMLGLEMLGMDDDASSQREITVTFTKMVKERDSERTYTLKRPSRNLPQWIEELTDVPLDMLVGKRSLRPRIEAMSVKSFDLRVKFKQDEKLDGIDLRDLKEAKISVQRPDFLLNSLRDGLVLLPFEDDKDLRNDLTEHIEFVFGPPGTGKTTFLAEQRIKSLMYRSPGLKVLVLTPTNKAADVLASRVVSCMKKDREACKQWLVRFGATSDEFLEKSGIVCGKNVDIGKMDRCCVVATIARFPYDKYVPGNAEPTKIEEEDWDYIIIDEASMIPLVYLVYVLYRKPKTKFIIAGDPFQIDPIVRNAGWEGENIYRMVGLKDFANPTTIPRAYPVEKLTTQYRSIPCIGEIFSRYRYGGVLSHSRRMEEKGDLSLRGLGEVSPLLIVKFPVSNYESIYSLKRLRYGMNAGSPYQIYSAIFTFELVCAIAKQRVRKKGGRIFRIGIISPYKSQADLVQRLIESEDMPPDAEVVSSTVHGFQGDECDMIIALFNPPPGISGGKRAFINRENIVNVAISRARDYLVLVMPEDETPKIENMVEVRKIEAAMLKANPMATVFSARRLEQWMFGSETYIEDNAFSSGHQSVNVYGDPERRYEVRSEDTAIDIQIHSSLVASAAKGKQVPKEPVPAAPLPIDEQGVNGFLTFLKRRVLLRLATQRAREYRAKYHTYLNLKAGGNAKATEKAYHDMCNAARFFHAHFCDYRLLEKNVPPFDSVMSEVVRRLNANVPLWEI